MRTAIEKAAETYAKWGNDLALITRELGLLVLEEELTGRLREVYFGDAIVIRSDLTTAEKRELVAHAIGHHLLHAGNHFAMQKRIYSFGNRHEKQANAFAAWLLIPDDRLEQELLWASQIAELAEIFDVTEELMTLRLRYREGSRRYLCEESPATTTKPLTGFLPGY